MPKTIVLRLTLHEARALLTAANYALLDSEAPFSKKDRGATESALKDLVTSMGFWPEMSGGMVTLGRQR